MALGGLRMQGHVGDVGTFWSPDTAMPWPSHGTSIFCTTELSNTASDDVDNTSAIPLTRLTRIGFLSLSGSEMIIRVGN